MCVCVRACVCTCVYHIHPGPIINNVASLILRRLLRFYLHNAPIIRYSPIYSDMFTIHVCLYDRTNFAVDWSFNSIWGKL